jgi:hypothetical protein
MWILFAWLVVRAVAPVRVTRSVGTTSQLGTWCCTMLLCWRMRGGLETNIKAVKIRDGTEICHIGFLPRHIVYGGKKEQITNKFVQVLELYKDSNDMTKKGRMIGFVVLLPFAFWIKSRLLPYAVITLNMCKDINNQSHTFSCHTHFWSI